MYIQLPVTTEVIEKNQELILQGKFEDHKIVIELDTRNRDYRQLLHLPRGEALRWINERTFEVQELSSFAWPIVYRVTTADGYYHCQGQRVYFTPEIAGLSTRQKVSDVARRLAVFLSIIAGLGYRQASWLMGILFQVTLSKSALARWVEEIADELPSADQMVKLLEQQQAITQGHLDEIFPLGSEACVLVLKDEHGRLIATQEVEKRDAEQVRPFLERLQGLGLKLTTFYIDHCQAYVQAIGTVYPRAHIQFDYFHILQNIWRHLWGEFHSHRRTVKARGEASQTQWYAAKLKQLAIQLWKHRYLFFTAEDKLTAAEKEKMLKLLHTQPEVSFLRGFLQRVWAIFEEATTEPEARQKFAALKQYAAHHEPESGFGKSLTFLETHFANMITFLPVPGVQRNSLAETGMRVLRRLERSHDGFRTDKARQDALKIYQAVMYLDWSIHKPPNLANTGVS